MPKAIRVVYELTYQRQALSAEARLFEVGVQENAILQLVAVNPNATRSGAALSANVLSRLGGKGSQNRCQLRRGLSGVMGEP